MKPIFLCLLAPVALAACAHELPAPQPVNTTGMASPELALQRSIASTKADMQSLGNMRPAPSIEASAQSSLPDDVTRRVWFAWSGSLTGAVQKLGHDIGYTVTVFGPEHKVRVVSNSVAPVVDILRALGDQAGDQATVSLDPLHHQIAVTYHA